MTKEEKLGLAIVLICLVVLGGVSHLLFPHSIIEESLVVYLLGSVLVTLLLAIGARVQWQKNLIFRVGFERWLSSLNWLKPQNALIPLVELVVLVLNWPATLVVATVQLQVNKTGNGKSLKAQESSLADSVGGLYYFAVLNCVGALMITWIALRQPLSAPLRGILFVLLASIMLRHTLWLISPGGAMAWIRRQPYNPFVSYTILTLSDLASLTLIIAVSDFWFSGRPITVSALRSAATALYKGPKDLVSSLFPGTSLSPSQMFHAPFHQQVVLVAGVLFYVSIIRALSNSVFKRTDADLTILSTAYLRKGRYERTLACLSELSHVSALSEMSRARAQLAMGKIPEARASVRRSLNLDPSFVFDPNPTDAFAGLFGLLSFARESARQFWDAALQADVSEAMLFEILLEESSTAASEAEEQLTGLIQAFAQHSLLLAGACAMKGDPYACLTALASAAPRDQGERFVFDTLQCWGNLRSRQEEEASAYLQQWMEQHAEVFRLAAGEIMRGRVWERSLVANMLNILERCFRQVDATATRFVENMKTDASAALNDALPDYHLVQSFFDEKLSHPNQ